MTGYLTAALVFAVGLLTTVVSDMASQEIRDRLDHVPHAILRLAARRLTPDHQITVYQDEWLPELDWILTGKETRPITRLISGTSYAIGIFIRTRAITRPLRRPAPQASPSTPIAPTTGISANPIPFGDLEAMEQRIRFAQVALDHAEHASHMAGAEAARSAAAYAVNSTDERAAERAACEELARAAKAAAHRARDERECLERERERLVRAIEGSLPMRPLQPPTATP